MLSRGIPNEYRIYRHIKQVPALTFSFDEFIRDIIARILRTTFF